MAGKEKSMLDRVLSEIRKKHGDSSILLLGDSPAQKIEAISTGSITVDYLTGIGGFPRGRIIEIYGPESSGKTTLALQAIATAQKNGGKAAFIDAEYALDVSYAKKLGVDVGNLFISQPDYGEQALDIAESLVRSGALDIIVIDSVAALVPKAEIEGEMGDAHVGLQARLMSQALRKLTGAIGQTKTCLIFINQLRSKIGVMFGNPETTTGGNALKFYASMRIDVRKKEAIKDGTEVIGNKVKVKVVKNKVAPPFREGIITLKYAEGVSKEEEVLSYAIELDLVDKSGSWFTIDDQTIQGLANVTQYLRENPETLKRLEKEVVKKLYGNEEESREKEGTEIQTQSS